MAYPGANSAVPSDAPVTEQTTPAGSDLPPVGRLPAVEAAPGTNPAGAPRRIASEPAIRDQIFRPTDRPGEPITQGLPFGPGASFTRVPGETDARFRERTARSLETSPLSSPAVRKYAQRLREGR